MFERAKKFLKRLFGLGTLPFPELLEPDVRVMAEVKGWPDKWRFMEKSQVEGIERRTIKPSYPPTCHVIRFPEKIGSQAVRKASSKHFKPRTAHEKRLYNPNAKLEEEDA